MHVCYVWFCDFGQLAISDLLKNASNCTGVGFPVYDNKKQH